MVGLGVGLCQRLFCGATAEQLKEAGPGGRWPAPHLLLASSSPGGIGARDRALDENGTGFERGMET